MFRPGNSKSRRRRRLRVESMESRQLMAADLGIEVRPTETTEASIASSVSVSAADAGSTRATASDLGRVDGSISARGQVSFRDTLDVFRFELQRDAAVDLELTGLRRNADLFVANEAGQLVNRSNNGGRLTESLDLDLNAGTYFVGVQSRSFWGSSYVLNVNAELESSGSPSQPLAEVDYFGGRREWNLNAIAAPEAWAAGFTGQGVTIAVVDTGVDLDHPDLVSNLFVNPGEIAGDGIDNDGNGFVDDIHGYDFAGRDANPDDVGGHGTHVAGTIAAGNNGFGATGVAPDATILPVRVLGNNGSGSTNAVAAGIRYAADLGADIINLSLGGGYSRAIDAAIEYARGVGSFIVAAAGNESSSVPGFPARFSATDSNVISVGAHNSANQLAGFSNDVGRSGAVQIDAPGVGVFSTHVGGRYRSLSGTSMAAPHVAGVAALALSANPDLTPEQLRSLLVGGAADEVVGSDALGRLNAATTVAYASRGLTSPPIESVGVRQSGGSRIASSRFYRTTAIEDGTTEFTTAPAEVNDDVEARSDLVFTEVAAIQTDTPTKLVSTKENQDNSFTVRDDYFAQTEDVAATSDRDDDALFDLLSNVNTRIA